MATRIIRDYFSTSGLEYSLARIPIGGTDFSTRKYTYADQREDLNLTKFSLADEDQKYKVRI